MNRTRKLLEMNECSKTGSWAQSAIKVRGDLSQEGNSEAEEERWLPSWEGSGVG